QSRLEPEVIAVRRALEAGTLGAVRLATTHVHWWRDEDYYAAAAWRGDPAGGGGSLMNQGVHNVDLLQWLAGPVESVTAQQATLAHDSSAEDTTVATVRFTGGALGLISTTTATPPGSPATLTLYCERGVVEIGQGEITRWDVDGVPAPQTPPPSASPATSSSGATSSPPSTRAGTRRSPRPTAPPPSASSTPSPPRPARAVSPPSRCLDDGPHPLRRNYARRRRPARARHSRAARN